LKLGFVVQRYGADIAGGSEAHCRQLAQHLSAHHDITVLTTCARDYVSWENALPEGESFDGRVRVLRFRVARQRQMKPFAQLTDEILEGASRQQEEEWRVKYDGTVAELQLQTQSIEPYKQKLARAENERDEAKLASAESARQVQSLEKKLQEATSFLNDWKNRLAA